MLNPTGVGRHHSGSAKPPPPGDKPVGPAPPPPPWWRRWLLPVGLAITLWLLFFPSMSDPAVSFTYTEFLAEVDADNVATITIETEGDVEGELKDGTEFKSAIPVALSGEELLTRLESHGVTVEARSTRTTLLDVIVSFAPFLLLLGLFIYLGRRARGQLAGLTGVGRARANVLDTDRPSTRFSDIAGYEGVKREISEVVDFLKQPDRYARAGAMAPRGVLMVGPPGTGKTLFARAVAGEAEVPFISVTGSGFVEMFVGVGAARVRDLFGEARKRAPAIIFVDEIDAIGQRRGGGLVSNDEREQTLNQLLAEMDGFDPAEGVVVLAATNRPEILDPALLRAGRFDRQVPIPLPNLFDRQAILALYGNRKKLTADVDLKVVARGTPGFSGADLANLVNEAAIVAVRDDRDTITADDFGEARDRIILGRREGSNMLLPDERYAVAVHEAGHAMVAALGEHADPVEKVTILPAGQSLGATHQLPLDDRHLFSESFMLDSLATRLGGRAAELVVLGEGSTGAANDLAGATDLATKMVREFGLSPELGPVGYPSGTPMYLGEGGGPQFQSRSYAEATQRIVDAEVSRLLREAEERAITLLTEGRTDLDQLTKLLLDNETIDGEQVYDLVGRPFPRHLDDEVSPGLWEEAVSSPTTEHT
ncbi:MAG: ATP-dependent zinc metalloprotease FtsH [Acidimicrobiia bacterium]